MRLHDKLSPCFECSDKHGRTVKRRVVSLRGRANPDNANCHFLICENCLKMALKLIQIHEPGGPHIDD